MGKQLWKPGNMVYPLPAAMVSAGDDKGSTNILTIAWTGTVCTNPPMLYISVRPERYSYHMIKESGEFVVNLTTEKLAYATDYCGVRSGRDVDKWKEMNLTPMMQIAVAHILFNTFTTIVFFPLLKQMCKLIRKIIPGEEPERIEVDVDDLDSSLASQIGRASCRERV